MIFYQLTFYIGPVFGINACFFLFLDFFFLSQFFFHCIALHLNFIALFVRLNKKPNTSLRIYAIAFRFGWIRMVEHDWRYVEKKIGVCVCDSWPCAISKCMCVWQAPRLVPSLVSFLRVCSPALFVLSLICCLGWWMIEHFFSPPLFIYL